MAYKVQLANNYHSFLHVDQFVEHLVLYLRDGHHQTFWIGAIWSRWMGKDGSEIDSCCVLTTKPNELIKQLNHRLLPIIMDNKVDAYLCAHEHNIQTNFIQEQKNDNQEEKMQQWKNEIEEGAGIKNIQK